MAIVIDDRAREAIRHRRASGRNPTIILCITVVPVRGVHRTLSVGWAPRRNRRRDLVVQRVGDAVLSVDERVGCYARWHDVTISAWRLGPIEHLVVVDAWRVLTEMLTWEYTHPGLEHLPVA